MINCARNRLAAVIDTEEIGWGLPRCYSHQPQVPRYILCVEKPVSYSGEPVIDSRQQTTV